MSEWPRREWTVEVRWASPWLPDPRTLNLDPIWGGGYPVRPHPEWLEMDHINPLARQQSEDRDG